MKTKVLAATVDTVRYIVRVSRGSRRAVDGDASYVRTHMEFGETSTGKRTRNRTKSPGHLR